MSAKTKSKGCLVLIICVLVVGIPVAIFSLVPFGTHTSNLESPPEIIYSSEFEQKKPTLDSSDVLQDSDRTTDADSSQDSRETLEEQNLPTSEMIYETAAGVLQEEIPVEDIIRLLTHSNPAVRMQTVRALNEAEIDFRAFLVRLPEGTEKYSQRSGFIGLKGLFDSFGEYKKWVVPAFLETLRDDTLKGRQSNTPFMLSRLDEPTPEVLSMLAWTSDNHERPDTRIFAMNALLHLDREGNKAREIQRKRMMDPSGIVRLNAFQGFALDLVGRSIRRSKAD